MTVGKLIDISGAMSGGGSEMKSGGMTLSGGKSKVSKSSQEDEVTSCILLSLLKNASQLQFFLLLHESIDISRTSSAF